MNKLITSLNLDRHDDLYEALIQMHEGLSAEEQDKANAKLILLLANHIGDERVLRQAIQIASAPYKETM